MALSFYQHLLYLYNKLQVAKAYSFKIQIIYIHTSIYKSYLIPYSLSQPISISQLKQIVSMQGRVR